MKLKKPLCIVLIVSLMLGAVQFSGILLSVERHAFATKVSSHIDFRLLDQKLTEMESLMSQVDTEFEPYFFETQLNWDYEQIPEGTQTMVIQGGDVSDYSDESSFQIGEYKGRENSLIWTPEQTTWVEYKVKVEQGGLYEMVLDYHPYIVEGSKSYKATVMAVTVNGEFPFREARAIEFPRRFKDTMPLGSDDYGDHIRPRPIELPGWIERPFIDADSSYLYPPKWYLPEGEHTVRFQSYEPIIIDKLTLRPQKKLDDYETVSAGYPEGNVNTDKIQQIEAEYMDSKNEVSLQMLSDQDAMMSPKTEGKRIFNGVGGREWRTGGGAATWSFNVPESGRYKIAMRTYQGYWSNRSVFRKIAIDGEVPFEELLAYRFPYSTKWEGTVLETRDGTPFEFYLEEGEHTITMEVTYAPYTPVIKSQERVSRVLSDLNQDLNAMTGGTNDRNRTWDIVGQFPEIPERLEFAKDILGMMAEELVFVNGRIDNNSQSLITAVEDIEDMLEYPNDIPYKIDNLAVTQNKIGAIRRNLVNAPLAIDQFYIAPAKEKFPKMIASAWGKLTNGLANFYYSFSDERRLSYNEEEVLNVWMFMGRDYVNLLQDMVNQYFTPETGIKVKIDLVPREELIVLANATGKAPDVALGLTEGKPVEFAVRGAAEDLSTYPGFDELLQQFAPGAMQPYYFDEGWYAFPETQQFRMLFYRKDILERLNLEVPDTWEDVMGMLPTLQQNNYNFFIPPQEHLTFIYQNGADFYTEDGMKTALDTPAGFKSFKQVTDFFSIYGIDRQVPSFYQHFRDGFMPIGISDFNTYLEMQVAAPELHGWWGMAPLPGVENEDGVVERWSGGNLGMLSQGLGGFGGGRMDSGGAGQTAAMMFDKSINKDEGWEFLSWWLSAETQARFGMDLEGFYGTEFRWNTANIEAFSELPWTNDEMNVLMEQWRWYKTMMIIPGSYFIPRELLNAWNRTVLSGMNYRTSLEEAILNINRELERKAVEFDYRDQQGDILKTYDPPQINEPWEGVEPYVRD